MSSSEKIADQIDTAAPSLGAVLGGFGLVSWAVSAVIIAVKLAAYAIRMFGEDAPRHLDNLYDTLRQRHADTEQRRADAGVDAFNRAKADGSDVYGSGGDD